MRTRLMQTRRFGSALLIAAAAMCVNPASEVSALTLGANENVGDGVLTGSDGSITVQSSNGITYAWADTDGDGTPGPTATAGLNMAGFSLTRTTDNNGIILDLNDGSANGSITNGGNLSTSRNPGSGSTGSVTLRNIDSVTLHTITTATTASYFSSGGITISGATDITVTNLETATLGVDMYGVGAITVSQTGNFVANRITTTGGNAYSGPGNKLFTGGGSTAGMFGANRIWGYGGTTVGDVLIQSYRGVSIGSDGIRTYNFGTLATTRHPGSIVIRNVGVEGVTVSGILDASSPGNQNNYIRPVVITNVAGPVSVANIHTHADSGDWCNRHSGDIVILAAGRIQTGNLSTYWRATSPSYRAGSVIVTSAASSIVVGSITATNGSSNTGNFAGNATLTAHGNIDITGPINLNAASGGSRRGTLTLTTSPGSGGLIQIGDESTDVLDCALLNSLRFNSDFRTSYIRGSLVNFDTTSTGGTGAPFDPLITTQITLRAPSGQRVYYTYLPGELNDCLAGKAYKLADLAGNANQGGILMMEAPRGTVVIFR